MSGKGIRLRLSPYATKQVSELSAKVNQSLAGTINIALSLLALYVEHMDSGKEWRLVNPKDPSDQIRLRLPFQRTEKGDSEWEES